MKKTLSISSILEKAKVEIKEKMDVKNTVKKIAILGKKHGPAFLIYAIAIEVFEDIVLPVIFGMVGLPELIPAALAFHMEPVAYPAFFAVKKLVA